MATTLHQILNYQTLTGIVNDVRGGVPSQSIPAGFFTPTNRVRGDTIDWYQVAGTRQTARVAMRASASQRREMKGLTERSAKALFVHEHLFHDVDVLNNLRQVDNPALQDLGRQEIARQAAYSRTLLDNFRAAAVASVLFAGKIRYSIGQGLLDPNGQTGTEIDFGVPAGNKSQLDVLGGGDIISEPWESETADIVGQITALKAAALKKTGYPIMHAFYGDDILGYLLANAQVQQLLQANTALAAAFTAREIPAGFMGLTWHYVGEFFFQDDSENYVTPVAADKVVFTPDPSPDWWGVIEGSYEVPTNIGAVANDAAGALGNFATVFGRFNYATISADPSGIKHNYGDTFLPVLRVPNAVFIADTVA